MRFGIDVDSVTALRDKATYLNAVDIVVAAPTAASRPQMARLSRASLKSARPRGPRTSGPSWRYHSLK